jgi:hypothetical protein
MGGAKYIFMRRNLAYLTCTIALLSACSSTPPIEKSGGDAPPEASRDGGADDYASGAPSSEAGGPNQNPDAEAGVLTAGVWDDNRNYDLFRDYRATMTGPAREAAFPSSDDEHGAAYTRFSQAPGSKALLDVALVIDTTGSMGDEIVYLQAEFDAMAASIREKFPTSEQRWSLVAYRDVDDEYVTRSFDFVDQSELSAFRQQLGEQSADGGGDFPEAPEQGLAQAARFAWRGDDAAKLLFWVADAPPHPENAGALVASVRELIERGVHVYPIASSGVDDSAEYAMRSSAQLSGGRYVFLTDDSGVGGEHKEPRVPCYFVTKLNDAIVRLIGVELSGDYSEPSPAQILRRGGAPQAGRCPLADGRQASVF